MSIDSSELVNSAFQEALSPPTDAEIEAASAAILEAMDITDGLDTESADTYARAAIEAFLLKRRG